MDKKQENILFPLGFNSLSITTMAYMRLKTEMKEDFERRLVEFKKEMESEMREKISKDIYNEVYEKLLEKMRRHDDGWEKIETEKNESE